MSNYTDQEVQDAVEKIVRSSVRHPTGILGDRKIETTFSDLQEAAAGCFILYFNAPFYVLFLGVKRLMDLLDSQASTVESLIDAVQATDRLTSPVTDLSPLANAKAALEELESAVSSRSQGFSDIEKVPAFRRYVQNLDSFIGATGSNIKSQGAIVDTPSGARAKIPGLVKLMVDQHSELIRRVTLLSGALVDFASLNLPQIAAQGVISRARDVLDQHYTDLSALDENSRLDNLRAVTLDLLTQKPLVKKYGAAAAPSEFIATSGLASAFADTEHPATPAARASDSAGPYPILAPNQFIRFTMDGGTSFDYPLPLSLVAELLGTQQEPFTLDTSSNNLQLEFGNVDTGITIFNIPLTTGTRTAAQVVAEINVGLGASSLRAQRRFFPVRYSAPVTTLGLVGSNVRFTIFAGDLNQLGVVVGDEVDVTEGTNAGTTWTITAVDPAGQYVEATGIGIAISTSDDSIEIGPAARALRLIDTDELGSVVQRRTLRIPADSPKPITSALLGFFPGAELRSRPVSAEAVVSNINSSTSALKATLVFHPLEYTGNGRSVPTDPTRVVLSKLEGSGTTTGGTNVTVSTAYFDLQDTLTTSDRLVIRASVTAADVGKEGVITSVVDDSISVTFPSAITGGFIDFEVGPDVEFGFGDVIVISDGPNAGRYMVGQDQEVGTDATFEVILEGVLPVPKDGDKPVEFTVELGAEDVTFASRDTTLASAITIDNAGTSFGADYFLDPINVGVLAIGSTKYVQFATFPEGVTVGDLFQEYIDSYNVLTREFFIMGVDASLKVLTLDDVVPANFSLSFDFNVPNPFGRLRVFQVATFADLKERCDAWLALPQQQSLYFRDLARFLNPILTNANPTPSMVNDALNQLKKLLALLTEASAVTYGSVLSPPATVENTLEFALSSYEAPAQEPVDVLLSTFRQKGADRAIDLLLEGQFSTFFNLGVDGVSYSGALMSALRDTARQDLPVRKFNRADTRGSKLIGAQPDQQDFEFSSDDVDSPNAPDIPMAPDTSSPGENI